MDKVVLGPTPCAVCKAPITWNGWIWQENGQRHICYQPVIDAGLRDAGRVIAASGQREKE